MDKQLELLESIDKRLASIEGWVVGIGLIVLATAMASLCSTVIG